METIKDSTLAAREDRARGDLWRAETILAGLGGTAEGWEYFGEVHDLGRVAGECLCGHPIRYEFLLRKEGRVAILGSECINSFHGFSPELVERIQNSLKALTEARKEAARLSREMAEEDAIKNALSELLPVYNEAREICKARGSRFVCPEVYALRLPEFDKLGLLNFWGVKTRKTLLSRINGLRAECELAIAANKSNPPRKFAAEVMREQVRETLPAIEPLLEVLRAKARESFGEFVCNMRDELETGRKTLAGLPPRAFEILRDIWAKETSGRRRGSNLYKYQAALFEGMAAKQEAARCRILGNESLKNLGLLDEELRAVAVCCK